MINRKHEVVTNAIGSLLKRENRCSCRSTKRSLDVDVMHRLIERARRFLSDEYSCYTDQPQTSVEAYEMALSEFVHALESDLRIWAIAIIEGDSNV